MIDEVEIIKRCIRKDRKAQVFLFEKYASVLLGVCRRYSTDLSEAEDMLQEGFVKIFMNLKSFAEKGKLINWMKRIMVNTAITWYHKNTKHRYHYDIDDQKVGAGLMEDNPETDFTRDELLEVIDGLPSGYKMVFNLYAIEGYKHKEIASLLEIDINTSKSQYSRAKKIIREHLIEISKRFD